MIDAHTKTRDVSLSSDDVVRDFGNYLRANGARMTNFGDLVSLRRGIVKLHAKELKEAEENKSSKDTSGS